MGRWLWFKPDVINKALEFRGSTLDWYTAETGRISMGPDGGVHFGTNDLGLVNVYAKDIRFTSAWQQQIWSGFNVVPDGRVSRELLMAQAEGEPASTHAPESFIKAGIEALNDAIRMRYGIEIVRPHTDRDRILRVTHRFRAIDESGFHALAKDLTRVLIDSLDVTSIQKIVAPPKGEKRASLKSLEAVIATLIPARSASLLMKPFFGIYELKLADAHMPASDLAEAYRKVYVDRTKPWVVQGAQILLVIVDVLHRIAKIISGG